MIARLRQWRSDGLKNVTPHSLHHTAMHRGVTIADAAGYFGVSTATLERVYWHHHPDFQRSAVEAMERK
jgi:hypothetical protein